MAYWSGSEAFTGVASVITRTHGPRATQADQQPTRRSQDGNCSNGLAIMGSMLVVIATVGILASRPVDNKGRFDAEGSSYEWNVDLNGHRIGETRTDTAFLLLQRGNPAGGITNFVMTFPPGKTPILDHDDIHPRPPRSGKNVVFMDGHVAPLDGPASD